MEIYSGNLVNMVWRGLPVELLFITTYPGDSPLMHLQYSCKYTGHRILQRNNYISFS